MGSDPVIRFSTPDYTYQTETMLKNKGNIDNLKADEEHKLTAKNIVDAVAEDGVIDDKERAFLVKLSDAAVNSKDAQDLFGLTVEFDNGVNHLGSANIGEDQRNSIENILSTAEQAAYTKAQGTVGKLQSQMTAVAGYTNWASGGTPIVDGHNPIRDQNGNFTESEDVRYLNGLYRQAGTLQTQLANAKPGSTEAHNVEEQIKDNANQLHDLAYKLFTTGGVKPTPFQNNILNSIKQDI